MCCITSVAALWRSRINTKKMDLLSHDTVKADNSRSISETVEISTLLFIIFHNLITDFSKPSATQMLMLIWPFRFGFGVWFCLGFFLTF